MCVEKEKITRKHIDMNTLYHCVNEVWAEPFKRFGYGYPCFHRWYSLHVTSEDAALLTRTYVQAHLYWGATRGNPCTHMELQIWYSTLISTVKLIQIVDSLQQLYRVRYVVLLLSTKWPNFQGCPHKIILKFRRHTSADKLKELTSHENHSIGYWS